MAKLAAERGISPGDIIDKVLGPLRVVLTALQVAQISAAQTATIAAETAKSLDTLLHHPAVQWLAEKPQAKRRAVRRRARRR